MTSLPPLLARLSPASFPHPVEQLQLRETAISWVILTGCFAYKIKKPLHTDFLDASTLAQRRFLCEEELRLNHRFAPQLYLDVLPIGEADGHPTIGTAQRAIEYAVRMRQFSSSQELAHCLSAGTVTAEEMAGFGVRLADWHASAAGPSDPDYGSAQIVRAQVLENFPALRPEAGPDDARRLDRLETWSRAQLAALNVLIDTRRRDGRVRECHGDLHAGNVVRWQNEWLPFDCVEFAPRLRWIDVMSDVAFLFMDLSSWGRADLAFAFLSAYLERGGDYAGLPLLSLYGVYRALVRAKVDALAGDHERQHARVAAAERLQQGHAPALILMHGVSGSGKSWLSSGLVPALGAVRVRSDLERRRLLGPGAHSAGADDATYQRLYDCARHALMAGLPIIVDATFLQPAKRRPYLELAQRTGCPLLLIDCRAPAKILQARIASRAREARDPSDADSRVLRAQLAAEQDLEPGEHPWMIRVDTSAPNALEDAIVQVRARLQH